MYKCVESSAQNKAGKIIIKSPVFVEARSVKIKVALNLKFRVLTILIGFI